MQKITVFRACLGGVLLPTLSWITVFSGTAPVAATTHHGRALYVAQFASGVRVNQYDSATGAFIGDLGDVSGAIGSPQGYGYQQMAVGLDGNIYISGGTKIARLDAQTHAVSTFLTAANDQAVLDFAFGSDRLYVSQFASSVKVDQYNVETGVFVSELGELQSPIIGYPQGQGYQQMAIGLDGSIYVSGGTKIGRLDPQTHAASAFLTSSNNEAVLALAFVPEPSTSWLAVLVATAVLLRRRHCADVRR